jgi:hypothetical protein
VSTHAAIARSAALAAFLLLIGTGQAWAARLDGAGVCVWHYSEGQCQPLAHADLVERITSFLVSEFYTPHRRGHFWSSTVVVVPRNASPVDEPALKKELAALALEVAGRVHGKLEAELAELTRDHLRWMKTHAERTAERKAIVEDRRKLDAWYAQARQEAKAGQSWRFERGGWWLSAIPYEALGCIRAEIKERGDVDSMDFRRGPQLTSPCKPASN